MVAWWTSWRSVFVQDVGSSLVYWSSQLIIRSGFLGCFISKRSYRSTMATWCWWRTIISNSHMALLQFKCKMVVWWTEWRWGIVHNFGLYPQTYYEVGSSTSTCRICSTYIPDCSKWPYSDQMSEISHLYPDFLRHPPDQHTYARACKYFSSFRIKHFWLFKLHEEL